MRKLPRAFYDRDALPVVRELLGKYLVHVRQGVEQVGRIVEVEAYLGPHDLAAHSGRGLTARTKVMNGRDPVSDHLYIAAIQVVARRLKLSKTAYRVDYSNQPILIRGAFFGLFPWNCCFGRPDASERL